MFGSIFSWWLVLQVLGLVALPLTTFLFRHLPLRGYPFSKTLGLLLVGYLSWLLAMIGVLPFGAGAAAVAIVLVGAAGWWVALRGHTRDELVARLQARWRPILAYEVLFAVALYLALWLRWHFEWSGVSVASTEKPMDLAFLTGIITSERFPPQDPWLAGYPINYYYLGYVMVAVLKVLSGVTNGAALTLGVATSFALAALMIAGLVVTLATLHWRGDAATDDEQPSRRAWGGIAAAALLGIVLAFVAGNQWGSLQRFFGTDDVIGIKESELLRAIPERLAGAEEIVIAEPVNAAEFGTAAVLRVDPRLKEDPAGYHFEWWTPTRALWDDTGGVAMKDVEVAPGQFVPMEVPDYTYSITEIPFFSLFLGDMHPHILAMPFELLALALALATALRASAPLFLAHKRGLLELAISGVIIGSIYAINSWSAPTYALLYAGALALLFRRLAYESLPALDLDAEEPAPLARVNWSQYGQTLASVGIASFIAIAPFMFTVKSLVGNQEVPAPWADNPLIAKIGKYIVPVTDHAEISEFVIIFGVFFAVLLPFALLLRQGLPLAPQPDRPEPRQLGVVAQPIAGTRGFALSGWHVTGLVLVVGALLEFPLLALLPLAGTLALEAWRSVERPVRAFALRIFATTAFVLFMTDLVFIHDHFHNRMNTVFKFYYQVWILWAMLGGYAVWALLRRARRFPGLTAAWAIPATLLFIGALVYPYATLKYSTPDNPKPEIDALAFLSEYHPDEAGAVRWVAANTQPREIVLTAIGNGYDEPGRMAAATGRPTLLGWNYSHEQLWRAGDPVAMAAIHEREQDIPRIYSLDTPESEVYDLLKKHNVRYIYVSPVEREKYTNHAPDRLATLTFLEQVYSQGEHQIYRVR